MEEFVSDEVLLETGDDKVKGGGAGWASTRAIASFRVTGE